MPRTSLQNCARTSDGLKENVITARQDAGSRGGGRGNRAAHWCHATRARQVIGELGYATQFFDKWMQFVLDTHKFSSIIYILYEGVGLSLCMVTHMRIDKGGPLS